MYTYVFVVLGWCLPGYLCFLLFVFWLSSLRVCFLGLLICGFVSLQLCNVV